MPLLAHAMAGKRPVQARAGFLPPPKAFKARYPRLRCETLGVFDRRDSNRKVQ